MAKKTWKAWGGFCDDTLHIERIDDAYGELGGYRDTPAVFTNLREARQRFRDVRPILITIAPKAKQRGKT